MPSSWQRALNAYRYAVDLRAFERASQFPGFFQWNIRGDRASTIEFEDYFRSTAPSSLEAYFEVIFWKLYSQPLVCQRTTCRILDNVVRRKTTPLQLWTAVQAFVVRPALAQLQVLRDHLGIRSPVLAVALTFPAFCRPDLFPVVDRQISRWVNSNNRSHSCTNAKLSSFKMTKETLQDEDFESYLAWVQWCREQARVLSALTRFDWRPRDVEMAVFTAQRAGLRLNVLQ